MLIAASRNLCADFYKETGIEPPLWWAYNGQWVLVPRKTYRPEFTSFSPAYDLDFLVPLLPLRTGDIRNTAMLGRGIKDNTWSCVWRDIVSVSDKPADAVIVLLITAVRREALKISTHYGEKI
jgi:hypothetical protein